MTLTESVTIEGETWHAKLSREEYEAWVVYDNNHPWLGGIAYPWLLTMFLAHFRRGINLNIKP